MIDLRSSLECMEYMKSNNTYRGERIGIIRKEIKGMVENYSPGEVVLFLPEDHGYVTLESAMSAEQIQEQREKGSLISTIKTMVGIPPSYIEEIVLK